MTTAKLNTSVLVSWLVLGVTSFGAAVPTPMFSAELVTSRAGRKPNARPGHVYVSGDQVRIETPEFADSFFIVDGERTAAWFVRPRQALFMAAKRSSALTQLLVSVDPSDPCRRWQIMEQLAAGPDESGEWHCDLRGRELIQGRETIKYLAISPRTGRSYRWIDPERAFPVRIETEDGATVALEHIVDAPQPSSLFAIPAEYHKFDPAQLIEIIKRSDVWVELPR